MGRTHDKDKYTVKAHKRYVAGKKRAVEVKKHARYVGAYAATGKNRNRAGATPRKKFLGLF